MEKKFIEYLDIICEEKPSFLKKYIFTSSMQRLKYIDYFCGMKYGSKHIYNFLFPISRLDHSISTALISWNFTYDKETTIAGLIHDIATPCFSHTIDYMNGDYVNQESTEIGIEKAIESDKELISFFLKKR